MVYLFLTQHDIGRERRYFDLKLFAICMLNGVMQSATIFFLICCTYNTTSSRNDGRGVQTSTTRQRSVNFLYPASTESLRHILPKTMIATTATVVNLINGLNTALPGGSSSQYLSLSSSFEHTLLSIPKISPEWLVTDAYGDNRYTFPSSYFWFGIIAMVLLSILPRYVLKAYRFIYPPDDIDILRSLRGIDPEHDIAHEQPVMGNLQRGGEELDDDRLTMIETRQSEEGRTSIPARGSFQGHPSYQGVRPSTDAGLSRANPSQVDISTSREGTSRDFDFSTEEGGYAMRRVQTHLSERHVSRVSLPAALDTSTPKRRQVSLNIFSSLRKSKGRSQTTPASAPPEDKKPPPPSPPAAPRQ
ncbi:hypothetical protein FRC05_006836 [Tulasnella sp. 425]|nr:hypothetical protein FRC05_006836 [Tulasnella sp. 425]